ARNGHIMESGIYSGEVIDMTADTTRQYETEVIDIDKSLLTPRLSPAIKVINKIKPVELIHTPAGESVLDMGQNMVGMLAFNAHAKKGTKIYLQFGEILQDGNFYRDNLRTAKAEFTYISDGEDRRVRQHFTFYGFRFVKVTGWEGEIDLNDFEGEVIHSEMEELGSITTSDELVNRLVLNAKWGMKGNFVDVPTDCPQRDERYGWTGDAQIFSGTACFFMDTYAFYTKYGKDLYEEQKKMGGSVPDVVPVANYPGGASTAWADAATIIPWNVYLHYGDRGILVRQYESMKGWVDFMKREDDADGGKGLWNTGSHYADWLALDGNYPGGVYGETDPNMIASGYYYYSTKIVATAAKIIGKDEDAAFYEAHAKKIYDAFVKEYFSPSGRLAVDTMTAYVIVLYFGLTPEEYKERVRRGLLRKLQRNRYHLETGFVGTPYLCRVLSENGMNDLAYHLLMEKGYPGWLYEVIMGATTIWERWNSVEPDGKISGTAMNSLNHYSYGSIVEWMFRNMLGINPDKEKGGFKAFTVKPLPDHHITSAEARLNSAAGLIRSSWKIEGDKLKFEFEVPFDSEAVVVLPDADAGEIEKAAAGMDGISGLKQDGSSVCFKALAGTYSFEYKPTTPYRKKYSIFTPYKELLAYEPTRKILDENYHVYLREVPVPFEDELFTLEEMLNGPFTSIPKEAVEKLDRLLREVE
nr:family 78 glycoside hydrolase catalytic domain [Lachnospiraceae bacterium]